MRRLILINQKSFEGETRTSQETIRIMLYGCQHTGKNIPNNSKFEEDYWYNAKLDVISVTISPRIVVKED